MSNQAAYFYEFGQFRVDPQERLLLHDGREIKLYPKDFDTLLVLLENSGRALEKDELLEKIWPDAIVEEGSLAQNVSRLRKVLGEGSKESQYIETLPRRGYRFCAEVRQVPCDRLDLIVRRRTRARIITHEEEGFQEDSETPRALPEISQAVKSLAVLPFNTLGLGGGEEYLGLGLADALITQLGSTQQMVVRPTSAIRGYTNAQRDSVEIGRKLHVNAVLEGSVQRLGERMRVTVQLVGVRDEAALWTGKFNTRFTDIFEVQDVIADQVSSALMLKLSADEESRLKKRYTENVEAYQAYLKGRFYSSKFTLEGLRKSIDYFNRAIDIDPTYALAYAGLSLSYNTLMHTWTLPKDDGPRARHAARKALEFDPMLAEAHYAMGSVHLFYEWNWAEAERESMRALELNPNSPDAHMGYGSFLKTMGRYEEQLIEDRRAQELDPLSLLINVDIAEAFYYSRRYDETLAQGKKILELSEHFFLAYHVIGRAYEQKGMYDEAIRTYARAQEAIGRNPFIITMLAHVFAVAGRRKEALQIVDELTLLSKEHYVPSYHFGLIYTGLGETDKAIEWLEKAFEERFFLLIWMRDEPRFDRLRSDTRFIDLLHRIGFTDE